MRHAFWLATTMLVRGPMVTVSGRVAQEEERLVRACDARTGALVVISQQALAASAQARDPLHPSPTAFVRA